jgi:Rhs element Vgr protein
MSSHVIPTQDTTDLSSFRILVEGEDVSTRYGIASIQVHKSVNKIPTAKLILADGDVSKQDFETSSSDVFNPGKEVTIKLGYHQNEDIVFKGVIIRHGIKASGKKSSMLTLELKDKSVKMTIARKNAYFADVTDSDVIEQVIDGAGGLEKEVTSTSAQHPEMIQYYCTDWDFIVSRADVNGMLVFVDDGKITVKAPEIGSPLITLAYGANIYEFEAEMDARDQYNSVSSSAWDPSQQAITSEDGSATLTEAGEITTDDLAGVLSADYKMQHTGKISSEELTAWANAKVLRSKLAKIQGRVKIVGFSDIKPGDTITLEQFGKNFNGKVFVSEVAHQYSADSAWYTDIQFGLSQEWFSHKYNDVVEKPASGLLPGINGLHIGIVTQIEDDPDSEFRVKIRIPIISPDDEGSWARISTLDAGNARGSFFRPEVDDEVVVGFLNDDPRSPVILGMLHSSSLAAPLTPTSDNFQKGFFTRENIQLVFDDDKKSVTILTPGNNSIVISDDKKSIVLTDQNNNKIEMSDKGIILESGKDISLKASSGDIKIEGMNITLSADSQFKAEGNSGVEMSSSAKAVLKGGVVQIN